MCLGEQFLKLQYITSKTRERIFQFVNICIIESLIVLELVLLLTRNESYSVYQFIRNEYYGPISSLLAFLLFVFIITMMTLEYALNTLLVFNTLFLYCFSLKHWVHKIWSVLDNKSYILCFHGLYISLLLSQY